MQLITLTADETYEANTFQPAEEAPTDAAPVAPYTQVLEAESSGHLVKQSEEWRDHSGQRKRFRRTASSYICQVGREQDDAELLAHLAQGVQERHGHS
ncbi:hypothetical protein PI124_g10688 [Phytophthora idaei]|nr:hypothetical protein PI124_g10688 [Phytophthora idaei]